MKSIEQQREELKDEIVKEGDELRKSLLDKLFNFNAILSAAFLLLYQFDHESFEIRILNILPFCTSLLILLYQLIGLRTLGHAYHKLDDWKRDDIKKLENFRQMNFNIIFFCVVLTGIEVVYLFNNLLS